MNSASGICVLLLASVIPFVARAQAMEAGVPRDAHRLPVLRGRVVTPDDALPQSTRVVVDWGGASDTVAVDAHGVFALPLRTALGDSAEIIVSGAPAYRRTRLRLQAARMADEVRLVLVPRRWRIRGGWYAGEVVDIDAAAVVRASADRSTFGRLSRAVAAPRDELVGWPAARFPIPLALRRYGGVPIRADDSTAFWRVVHDFEEQLGAQIFRPASDSSVEVNGWGAEAHVDPRISTVGLTFITWTNGGTIFDASVAVRNRSYLGDAGVIIHELLHVLGFGHTSSWPTMMTRNAVAGRDRLTREDVAYAQLLMKLRELEVELGAPYGLVAALEE